MKKILSKILPILYDLCVCLVIAEMLLWIYILKLYAEKHLLLAVSFIVLSSVIVFALPALICRKLKQISANYGCDIALNRRIKQVCLKLTKLMYHIQFNVLLLFLLGMAGFIVAYILQHFCEIVRFL